MYVYTYIHIHTHRYTHHKSQPQLRKSQSNTKDVLHTLVPNRNTKPHTHKPIKTYKAPYEKYCKTVQNRPLIKPTPSLSLEEIHTTPYYTEH